MDLPIKIVLDDSFYKEEYIEGHFVSSDVKELWAIELDLLVRFDEICKKNNIKYWLDSGTLLGAIRHKGFIPWDDDIDVVVMRDGYEKLLKVAEDFTEPYLLQSAYTDKNYSRGHLQLRNINTCMMLPKEAWIVNFNQGIFLDIFVLDGVTSNEKQLKKQFMEMRKLKRYMKYITYSTSQRIWERPFKKIRGLITEWITGGIPQIYDKFSLVASMYKDSVNVDKLMFRNSLSQCKFIKKSAFNETLYVSFEGRKFPIPSGYDSILKVYYGKDYMVPIHSMSAHGNVIVDTRRSYTEVLKCQVVKKRGF